MKRMPCKLVIPRNGNSFFEGPVVKGDTIFFTDMFRSQILKVTSACTDDQELSFIGVTSECNGLAFDRRGQLWTCVTGSADPYSSHSVATVDFDNASVTTVVDHFNCKPLNSPNDLAIANDDTIYFTDPKMPLPSRRKAFRRLLRRIRFLKPRNEGVYCLRRNGDLTRPLRPDSISKPNGIGLSADEEFLYVVESNRGLKNARLLRFNIGSDSWGDGETIKVFDAHTADGMATRENGEIFVASDKVIEVLDSTGKSKYQIFPQQLSCSESLIGFMPSNLCFYGENGLLVTYNRVKGWIRRKSDARLVLISLE